MTRLNRTWNLGTAVFHLAEGDLFDVPAAAIVNSEQTDFILARHPDTISGQIRMRYKSAVQDELDDLTSGKTLARGTVLLTRSGDPARPIYHAGFHEPHEWLFLLTEDEQTDYISSVRICVRQILDRLASDGMDSVALPLIGTGLFGLNPALLLGEFMHELLDAALGDRLRPGTEIWLVLREQDLETEVIEAMLTALIDALFPKTPPNTPTLAITYLDVFARDRASSHHPGWRAWMLCRYTELIGAHVCYHLAIHSQGRLTPLGLMRAEALHPNHPCLSVSFGHLRDASVKLVKDVGVGHFPEGWPRFCAELIERDRHKSQQYLMNINQDRNNIAHGRSYRAAEDIHHDLMSFLDIDRWRAMVEKYGPADCIPLEPWVVPAPRDLRLDHAQRTVGILEQITLKTWRYVVPEQGSVFKVECPEAEE